MVRLFACAVFGAFLLVGNALCAEIELVSHPEKGHIIGIKLEGDIVSGDADKLLAALKSLYVDHEHSPLVTLSLASKGGDVREAMKIGRIVRRLRLNVEVPTYYPKYVPVPSLTFAKVSNPDNAICASSCFLVFAGGADRSGNHIGLHRPYVSRDESASDVVYEEQQKKAMIEVRKYLEEMEVPTYFIDLMMSRNSQNVYLVTNGDIFNESHLLTGYSPSIEEFLLRQCETVSEQEYAIVTEIVKKGAAASPEEKAFRQNSAAKASAGLNCEFEAFVKIQEDAFSREFSSSKEESLLDGLDLSSIPDQPQQEKGVPKGAPGITNDRPAASAPQSQHNPFDDILPLPAQSMGSQPNR